jgi:hypothetical protein
LSGRAAAEGEVLSLDVGAAPARVFFSAARLRFVRRATGVALTLVVGPAAMAAAILGFKMGFLEGAAVLALLSGWLGPRLMRFDA